MAEFDEARARDFVNSLKEFPIRSSKKRHSEVAFDLKEFLTSTELRDAAVRVADKCIENKVYPRSLVTWGLPALQFIAKTGKDIEEYGDVLISLAKKNNALKSPDRSDNPEHDNLFENGFYRIRMWLLTSKYRFDELIKLAEHGIELGEDPVNAIQDLKYVSHLIDSEEHGDKYFDAFIKLDRQLFDNHIDTWQFYEELFWDDYGRVGPIGERIKSPEDVERYVQVIFDANRECKKKGVSRSSILTSLRSLENERAIDTPEGMSAYCTKMIDAFKDAEAVCKQKGISFDKVETEIIRINRETPILRSPDDVSFYSSKLVELGEAYKKTNSSEKEVTDYLHLFSAGAHQHFPADRKGFVRFVDLLKKSAENGALKDVYGFLYRTIKNDAYLEDEAGKEKLRGLLEKCVQKNPASLDKLLTQVREAIESEKSGRLVEVAKEALNRDIDPVAAIYLAKWGDEDTILEGVKNGLLLFPNTCHKVASTPEKDRAALYKNLLDTAKKLDAVEPKDAVERELFYAQNPEVPIEKYIEALKTPLPSKKPIFKPFAITTTRTVTHVPKQIKEFVAHERQRVLSRGMSDAQRDEYFELGGEMKVDGGHVDLPIDSLVKLQNECDEGNKKAESLLLKIYSDKALRDDETLRNKINSMDHSLALEGILELYRDRMVHAKIPVLSHPDRFAHLLKQDCEELQKAGMKESFVSLEDYQRYLENIATSPERMESLKSKVMQAKSDLDVAIRQKQSTEADWISKELAQLKKLNLEEIANTRKAKVASKLLQKSMFKSDSLQKLVKKAEDAFRSLKLTDKGSPVTLLFDSAPSLRDSFTGYSGGDCTKGRHDMFNAESAWNAKVFELEKPGDRFGKHVGNVYIVKGKDGALHLDAVQLPIQVDHKLLAEELPKALLQHTDPKEISSVVISNKKIYLSNHASVQNAWHAVHEKAPVTESTMPESARHFQNYKQQFRIVAKR